MSVGEQERLVKSAGRIRDLAEVFTPATTVNAMLDLLPERLWEPHPSPTFLEPAAGDGNFLVAVLVRKLDKVAERFREGRLPAGSDVSAVEFHALEALSSIYGVDISAENIVGGVPGHEVGARLRLLKTFVDWFADVTGTRLISRSAVLACANWIVERNLVVGNMLPTDRAGRPSGHDRLPLIEYQWHPQTTTVTVIATTLGAALETADASTSVAPSLFGSEGEPSVAWEGAARDLRSAPIERPTMYVGPAKNGRGST